MQKLQNFIFTFYIISALFHLPNFVIVLVNSYNTDFFLTWFISLFIKNALASQMRPLWSTDGKHDI